MATGKAMTYADKYALMKAYKIITGDDPDQEPSKPLTGRTPSTTKPTVKKGVSPELKAECESLGGTLEQIANKKGLKIEDLTDDIVAPILMAIKKKRAKDKAGKDVKITRTFTVDTTAPELNAEKITIENDASEKKLIKPSISLL